MRTKGLGRIFTGAVLAGLLSAGTPAGAGERDKDAAARPPLGAASRFGIDYVFPLDKKYTKRPYAETFARTGAGWVNFADIRWRWIEPKPPKKGRHNYKWDKLDAAVRRWQGEGFNIAMSLRLGKGWFAGPKKFMIKKLPLVVKLMSRDSDRLPKPKHMKDYTAWIRAFVERYDKDGVDDMPGLRYPVLHYQIGNEYGNPAFWTGTIEEYFTLLRTASKAAREANPGVNIIPSGLRLNDFFHNRPDGKYPEEGFKAFFKRLPPGYPEAFKRALDLDERVLGLTGVYDIVDAAGNGSWHTPTPGYQKWVRRKLEEAGNPARVWDMESRCEVLLTPIDTTHMHMDLGIPQGKKIVKILKRKRHRKHKVAVKWYRAEQSRILAKVYVTRFAAGVEKVFVGMPIDWDKGIGKLGWPNPYVGLLNDAGEPWPVYHALGFLVKELDGFTRAEPVPAPKGVSLYRFRFAAPRKPVWVAWLEDPKPRGLEAKLPIRNVRLNRVRRAVSAQEVPTLGDRPREKPFSRTRAGVKLKLTPTPVLIKE